ncbi:MAG: PD-(D/E)XK nuclease family protein, partial [Alloprevotella sp.]|nr:PD-(D/E)XK nuclease family protein [Alloprevotella sp.]
MKPFLQSVAEDLLAKHGHDLSRAVVVFPNRRAGLFFNEYLAQGSNAPVWAPRHLTISELFTTLSPLRTADTIETVCRIFRIYVSLTHSGETLDRFYGWGERLLADFDDVDKNMADAARLFINVRDYNNIDYSLGTEFTEEQRKALQRFLVDFRETDDSRLRRTFYALWDKMLPIYTQLNTELAGDGYAYEGALYRSVVEGLSDGHIKLPDTTDAYVFVGFNVLDEVERRLFSLLRDAGKARFYWDYDAAYCDENSIASEAGLFLRKNLAEFGNELPPALFNNLLQEKDITFVAAPTENAQAFSVAPWLQKMAALGGNPRRTAIVLCNENLVEPVLHAIPSEVTKLNITKGFPLSHTPAFALIERELTTDVGLKESNAGLLERLVGLVRTAAEEAEARLRPESDKQLPENAPWLRLLYLESYYEAHTTLERFIALTESGFLSVSATTLRRLLLQVLRQASIPFHGDPAEGIQVMGLLETRNLDFDNVLMLSVNEGMLPRPVATNSFIPYPLRKAYGLTDIERQTAVYAYYFYRLIQRASRLRMLYNNTSSGVRTTEMSRFMRQMLLSGRFSISTLTLSAKQGITETAPIRISKPAGLRAMLNPPGDEQGDGARNNALSPSALNRFVSCPLQFFFSRIARLKSAEPDSDEIQNTTFG